MTYINVFKRSISTAALAGAIFVTSAVAQAPYGAPTPDQYAAQNPQYAAPADANMNNDPNAQGDPNGQYGPPQDPNGGQGQYGPPQQQAMPQPGAPQGIEQAPPPIPDYQQPAAPGDGYIWTPGYWAHGPEGYEWVDGAWVDAPYSGALWTPGYWGDGDDGYFWNAGYWGPTVGYYGGINYGFGYFGIGFYGGYWGGGRFFYNRAYCNIGYGRGFNVYNRSYNGFSGHPGGSSFVHGNSYASHGGGGYNHGSSYAANRGSAINGNVHSSSYANGNSRPANTSTGGRSNYSGASRSYAQPSAQSHSNYSGAAAHSAPAGGGGGGYHGGGGGGGGGSHGGGGGGGHR